MQGHPGPSPILPGPSQQTLLPVILSALASLNPEPKDDKARTPIPFEHKVRWVEHFQPALKV